MRITLTDYFGPIIFDMEKAKELNSIIKESNDKVDISLDGVDMIVTGPMFEMIGDRINKINFIDTPEEHKNLLSKIEKLSKDFCKQK